MKKVAFLVGLSISSSSIVALTGSAPARADNICQASLKAAAQNMMRGIDVPEAKEMMSSCKAGDILMVDKRGAGIRVMGEVCDFNKQIVSSSDSWMCVMHK